MAFIGMESLNDKSLAHVHKTHNRVEEYRELFEKLRRAGVLTFAGLIFGLDADTVEYFRRLPGQLDEVRPEVVLMSIAIPVPGTPWHRQLLQEGRIVDDNLAHYEGDHLLFRPKLIQAGQLLDAFRSGNAWFYNWRNIVRRWVRYIRSQPGFVCLPGSVVRSLITSAIYFQLSVFQRHHAERRVLDQTALRQARGELSTSQVAGGTP